MGWCILFSEKITDMAKNIFLLLFFLIAKINFGLAQYETGAIYDKKLYSKSPIISPILKFNDPITLSTFSLKKYCPIPKNQGNMGSCTGWATGYAGLTIAESILDENTNKDDITNNARSALYVYNQLMTCKRGSHLTNVFEVIKNNGDCYYKEFNPTTCMILPDENTLQKGKDMRITNYVRLWDIIDSKNKKIQSAKRSLLQKRPVVIVLHLKKTFQNISKSGVYIPKNTDQDAGYHAVCLIGYDDEKQQFEMMNSWGENWGNEGFFFMPYDDFITYADEGYQFQIERNSSDKELNLYGNFELLKLTNNNYNTTEISFKSLPVNLGSDKIYYLKQPIKKDDFFRLRCMNLKKNSFVYLISLKPDYTSEILFPLHYKNEKINDVPFIPDNHISFELPENQENGYTAEVSGYDHLIVLYSNKPIEDLKNKISNWKEFNNDIWTWLNNTFPNRIIQSDQINYSLNNMGINNKVKYDGIIPIILKAKVL